MKRDIKFIICLASGLFLYLILFLNNVVLAINDANGNPLPDLAPLPSPASAEPTIKDMPPSDPPLADPPETYSRQVIIKYTQNYKESPREDGLQSNEKTLTVNVAGTIYPEYAPDYRKDMLFTGNYLFKEGQMSWSYNAKNYEGGSCNYLFTSVGSGNIDIGHTDKIGLDSKIELETDGEYTMDINNDGRIYLTADGLPIVGEDYNSAQKPVQMTTILLSGDPKFCPTGGAPTNEVPPEIQIRLENLKANKKILSGSETIHSTDDPWKTYTLTEMISYTIELPAVKNGDTSPEEPAISNDNPDKQGILDIFYNWIKNLFN